MAFNFGKKGDAQQPQTTEADAKPYTEHSKIESDFQQKKNIVIWKYRLKKSFPYIAGIVVFVILAWIGLAIYQNYIQNQDNDGDGIVDSEDICPGFDDLQDMDKDGLPDGCDDNPPPQNFNEIKVEAAQIISRADQDQNSDIYFSVTNSNPDWNLTQGLAKLELFDKDGQTLAERLIGFYIAAEDSRQVAALAVQIPSDYAEFEISVASGTWLEIESLPELRLQAKQVKTFEKDGHSVTDLILENQGSVIIRQIDIVVVARDVQGSVLAVNKTVMNDLRPGEERLAHLTWTSLLAEDAKIEVQTSFDVSDRLNFIDPLSSEPPLEF